MKLLRTSDVIELQRERVLIISAIDTPTHLFHTSKYTLSYLRSLLDYGIVVVCFHVVTRTYMGIVISPLTPTPLAGAEVAS